MGAIRLTAEDFLSQLETVSRLAYTDEEYAAVRGGNWPATSQFALSGVPNPLKPEDDGLLELVSGDYRRLPLNVVVMKYDTGRRSLLGRKKAGYRLFLEDAIDHTYLEVADFVSLRAVDQWLTAATPKLVTATENWLEGAV